MTMEKEIFQRMLLALLLVLLPCCSCLTTTRGITSSLSGPLSSKPRCILVAGSTGRLGSLVVRELLLLNGNNNGTVLTVRALMRDLSKGASLLPPQDDKLQYFKCDLSRDEDIERACVDADAIIFCASGVSDTSSFFDKVLGVFKLKFSPKKSLEIAAVSKIGSIFSNGKGERRGLVDRGPKVLLCSSAAVSRPSWTQEKKDKFPGSSDIPIVRLNPVNILNLKLEGEEALRKSGVEYAIARPCGLVNEERWPTGRPVFSQGDIAVGRTTRKDAARVLVDTLSSPASTGKTFEFFAIPGYPYPRDIGMQFSRLKQDPSDGSLLELPDDALVQSYNLIQQLVPGETMEPNKLAMGQRYEELDNNIQGRLGERGSEVAPLTLNN
jgi:hypothetical protein